MFFLLLLSIFTFISALGTFIIERYSFSNAPFLKNINSEKSFSAWTSYCISKLMNIMFTYQLSSIQDKVSVNVLHPGFVDTNIAGNEGNFIKYIVKFGAKMFARTVENGADSSIYLSTSDKVKGISGKYFFKCREIRSSRASYNKEDWVRVWDLCNELKNKLT